MADLDEIMAGRSDSAPAEQQTQQPVTAPQVEGQQPEPQAEQQPQHPEGYVPIQALDAEKAKRRKYTDEVADIRQQFGSFQQQVAGYFQAIQAMQRPQQQPEPVVESPDFDWDDPRRTVSHHVNQAITPILEQFKRQQETRELEAREDAVEAHGEDAVQAAYSELQRRITADPNGTRADYDKIMSASPSRRWKALMSWHKRTSALSEIGTDPDAYRERVRQQLMAELGQGAQPAAQPQQQLGSPQGQPMPTSFAGARNAGPRATPQWSGPKPLSEIMSR